MQNDQSMANGKILTNRIGQIMTITINRPHRRNALDNEAAAALTIALREFDDDDDISVAVLAGAGKSFCAGADLKSLAAGQMYRPWAGDPDGPCHDMLSKPLIGAIEGYACAGGLGLALRCDLRVASEGSRFAVLSRRWGVPMSDGTTVRLPQLIGRGRALDMLLTAREVTGHEAAQIGLVDRLCADGKALTVATELAEKIAGFPAAAMRADRQSLYAGLDLPLMQALQRETAISITARDTEAQSGAKVFSQGKGRHGSLSE